MLVCYRFKSSASLLALGKPLYQLDTVQGLIDDQILVLKMVQIEIAVRNA